MLAAGGGEGRKRGILAHTAHKVPTTPDAVVIGSSDHAAQFFGHRSMPNLTMLREVDQVDMRLRCRAMQLPFMGRRV